MSATHPHAPGPHPHNVGPEDSRGGSRLWIWTVVFFLLAGGGYYGWITFGPKGPPTKPKSNAVRVTTGQVHIGDIGVTLDGLGSVVPLNTVTVRTRVNGQLMEIYFEEGQLVKENDKLALIDPRPYQALLDQANGILARDEAALKIARLDLERYKTLWAQDSIARQVLETQEGTVKQDEGTVINDKAQVDTAKLNLFYCNITSPVTGKVGLRLVDKGNIVQTSDTNGLVVITQLQPIDVEFTLAEDSLPPVLKKLNAKQSLDVEIWDRQKKTKLAQGTLASADNQIDPTTGTLKFKALFQNEDVALYPNQFVNATLLVDTKKAVVLAPAIAIQRGTQNNFVYVVRPDNTVTAQDVTLGTSNPQEVEITKGLSGDEIVVVDGVDKLQEGSHITTQSQKDKSAPGDAK